jgi:Zn-dependent M28 family amino/carboxypeptidase
MKIVLFVFQLLSLNAFSQNADSIISKASLYNTVSFLSSDSLKGRLTGSLSSTIAANFIKEYFKENNVRPISVFPDYYDSFKLPRNIQGLNVIGAVPGYGSDSLIIISAHYDHIGKGKTYLTQKDTKKNDDIYNGANDNATGVAAMLEIAKYYAVNRQNYYTILFVAFSAEELGMIGSAHFINNMENPGVIKAVINLEMLGRPDNTKQCFYAGIVSPKIIRGFNKNVKKNYKQRNFLVEDFYPEQKLDLRSDHYSFMHKVPAAFTIMATSPYDEHYHSVTDEVATIDFDFLLEVTNKIATCIKYFGN